MKKRAQVPDAHTFTILLRGLAEHVEFPQSLPRAIWLYESMFAFNSHVKPSVKHTNAVLKVCARAKDLDSMWAIAAKLPARGWGAPDNLTFTTILNAVSQDLALRLRSSISNNEKSTMIEKAILHGRRMWDDIVGRWRMGDIWIDEELVCSMGRLLLTGLRPTDWDDVLSLVEQTMAVPRLLPRLGTPAREEARAPQLAAPDDGTFQREGSTDGEPEAGGEFDPVDISKVMTRLRGGAEPAVYARPGASTLSLILAACLKMRAKQTGQEYWALLTDPSGYAVVPDPENYSAYMRLLRQSRASKEAVTVLRSALASSPTLSPILLRKSFRIAMSACVRDINSPHAFKHASQILDLMQSALADLDVRTCTRYLELATRTNDGPTIATALERLNWHTLNLKSMLSYGSAEDATKVQIDEAKDAIALIKLQVSCCDRLVRRGEVGREEYGTYAMRKGKLAAWVTRWNTGGGWAKNQKEGGVEGGEKAEGEEEDGAEKKKTIRRGGRMVKERLEKRQRREERERKEWMERSTETQTEMAVVGF